MNKLLRSGGNILGAIIGLAFGLYWLVIGLSILFMIGYWVILFIK